MKKINYLVLMAAMMLIGTNVCFGKTWEVANASDLTTVWGEKAQKGDIIKLTADVAMTKTLWLGTQNMTDAARSLEIDLNGNDLSSSAKYAFMLTHGSLKISNSQAASGSGKLIGSGTCTNVFYITGSTNKDVDPSVDGSNYFTHLEIAAGVIVKHEKYDAAITIDAIWYDGEVQKAQTGYIPSKPALSYITNVYAPTATTSNKGVANGVRLDVKGTINGQKYGIKANGILGSPTWYFEHGYGVEGGSVKFAPNDYIPASYRIEKTEVKYSPFIHIYPSGRITALDTQPSGSKSPLGIYASGYARWHVEGYVEGGVGAMVKSGEVLFDDATVVGTGSSYKPAEPTTSGTPASGSAIVVESSDAYVGDIDVTISGDSHITAANGYAVDEAVNTTDDETNVDVLTITGGTFTGGTVPVDPEDPEKGTQQGTIKITETTADESEIIITGGTVSGNDVTTVQIGNQDLGEFLSDGGDSHVTTTDDGKGGKVLIITEGAEEPGTKTTVAGNDGEAVNWAHWGSTDVSPMAERLEADLTLEQLQINQSYAQVLTVAEGNTLEVGSVILGAKAQIIVEAGATLIVTGNNGIYAPVTSNLILQTQAGKPSIFLFNPAVDGNAHPHATVQFKSTKSFRVDDSNKQWERFGLPTWKAITSISCDQPELNTAIAIFGTSGWENCGILVDDELSGMAKLNKPFISCELLANKATVANATYTFTGELTGNMNADLNVDHEWTPFANSYSANVDAAAFIQGLQSGVNVDKFIYLAVSQGNNKFTWDPFDLRWEPNKQLAPMEAFILHNHGNVAENSSINYKTMVYDPATSGAGAPRRAIANDHTAKLRVVVEDAQGEWDNVKMTECSTDQNNAVKYMNDNINLFAHANDDKLAIVAAEDLDGTYFGFSTIEGGVFTISFTNVEGREFEFVDLEANKAVKVAEGNTYTFTAAPNTVADYRFKLVGIKNMPTAVDNLNAAKNQTGIYTIMGQYVGEMNLWNTLPAGVYVVNGEKRVK